VTGEQVLLNKGVLPQSVLASGAFPSLYTPVEIDGRMLIDGGVVNNYPIDEVREMGADIIIGIDVQDGLKKKEDIKGATDILMQIANYGMYKGVEEKVRQTDIYIKPDITNYTVVSFDKGDEIIRKGKEAALAQIEKIKEISSNYHKPNLPSNQYFDTISLKKIEVNRMNLYTKSYVLGKMPKVVEGCVPYADLETGINNLNATQNFTGINYNFVQDQTTGEDVLQLQLTESPYTRYLKFGLHYDQLYKSSLLLNVTQKKLLSKNDVASLDFVVGDNVRYNFNYFIDNGTRWSFGIQSRLSKFKQNIRSYSHGIVPVSDYSLQVYNTDFLDFSNRIYIQNYYRNRFLIGLGLEHKFQLVDVNNALMPKSWIDNGHYAVPYLTMLLDTYDNKYFPTRGIRFASEVKHFLLSSNYNNNFEPFTMINIELGFSKTFYKRVSLRFVSDFGVTIGSEPSTNHQFFHGGYGFESLSNLKHFYGYDVMSLNADSYLKQTFIVDYRFYKKHHLNFTANFMQMGDNMFETANWVKLPKHSGYALGYGFQSVIGPVEIKQSYSPENKRHYTWFAVGFWF
ncbi:MAG TPA: patatin-like phospholipase family protein, partial [Flavobacterium sp.]|nr:patatin-like phospholipase family protein [Flavobacterium sp.]